jgi:hypothetical protein
LRCFAHFFTFLVTSEEFCRFDPAFVSAFLDWVRDLTMASLFELRCSLFQYLDFELTALLLASLNLAKVVQTRAAQHS